MPLPQATLLDAYTRMQTIRVFEENTKIEFEKGNIPGFIHLYTGQEASAVGICMNLEDSDFIGSTHRGHGHCIAKRCDVKGMMKEIYGRQSGLCGGKGGSMHIADFERGMLGANAIVGGNGPLIIGAALTAKTLCNSTVAVSFMGDGGSNQGTTFESMNMAVVLNLPVIFVLENNGYGEYTSNDYAIGSKDMCNRAAAFGLSADKVDGTDFFAVYEAAYKAVTRARNGEGPSIIETVTKRWQGHYHGDAQAYRPKEEMETLHEFDPIARFKTKVLAENQIKADDLNRVDHEVNDLLAQAVAEASAAEWPLPQDLTTQVYVSY